MSKTKTEITGAQRAAAFLLSLDEESAAQILRGLDAKIMSEVVQAMTDLDTELCEVDSIRELYTDLARDLHTSANVQRKQEEELEPMLETTLGREQAGTVMTEIRERRRHERPFHEVEKHPPQNIAKVLDKESDAVVGLVLAHVDPALSAEVLSSFESERSLAVVRRMAALKPPPFETLNAVAGDLEARLEACAAGPPEQDPSDRLRTIAEMLNFTGGGVEKAILEGLKEDDEEMAAGIREYMFTWEDLAAVDKRAMQKILASVETRTLSIALKACSHAVEENIMGNLSSRVREMVIDERELAGAMPMSDVLAARMEIMTAVRGLMESGEFQPARSGEDLVT